MAICPRLALLDGIQAGRWLLQQSQTRFHAEKCRQGLAALRQYHYEYDDDTKLFAAKPEHDWSSHACDAFGLMALKYEEPRPSKKPREGYGPGGWMG